jgi:hypothetical protein
MGSSSECIETSTCTTGSTCLLALLLEGVGGWSQVDAGPAEGKTVYTVDTVPTSR